MGNFNTALEATDTAMNSAGSAVQENERYLDSIQGRISALTSELEKFWTEGISSDLVKNIVSFGTSMLQLVNDMGGLPTILTAVVGVIATLKGYSIASSIVNLGKSIAGTISQVQDLRRYGFSLVEVFTSLNTASGFASVAIGGFAAAITIAIAAINYYNAQQEKMRQEGLRAADTFNQQVKSLQDLKKQYNDILDSEDSEETKAANLAKIRQQLADTYGVEKEALDRLNESREQGNALLDEESFKRAEETYVRNLDSINEAQRYLTSDRQIRFGVQLDPAGFDTDLYSQLDAIFADISQKSQDMIVNLKGTPEELNSALVEAITLMSELENPTARDLELMRQLQIQSNELSSEIDKQNEVIDRTQQSYILANSSIQEFLSSNFQTKDQMVAAREEILATLPPLESYRNGFESIVDSAFPEWAETTEIATEELAFEMENTVDVAEDLADTLNDLASDLSGVQSAYDTLTAVAKEYNETGSLSADTLADLLRLNPEYLDVLSMQEGQLVVNVDQLNQMAQGYATAAYQAVTGSEGVDTFANSLSDTASAGSSAASSILSAGEEAIKAGQKALEGAKGFQALVASISAFANGFAGTGTGVKEYSEPFDAQVQAWKNQQTQDLLAGLTSGVTIDTSAGGRSGGGGGSKATKDDSAKLAKEAAKAYKDAFQKELDEAKFRLDTGQINAGEYYLELDRLNKEYYEGNEEYLDEYRKYYLQVVDGLHDATVDTYEGQHDELDHKLAMDLISEEQYLQELKRLYAEYYQDAIGYDQERNAAQEEIYRLEQKRIQNLKAERKKAWDEETDWLNEQKSRYETAFNYIDALAQKEIDALNQQIQAIKDNYDEQIDKINETNEALNDEIALQERLEALARAQNKRVRIYREGVGFVYENDQSAVDEAKNALTQFQKEQDTKKEIKRLEDIRDATIASVEDQIEYWEKYRQEWKDMVNSYTENQNRLIAEQVLGISLEGDNWETRLGNLQDYVDRYNSILDDLRDRREYDDDDWDDDYDDYDYGGGVSKDPIYSGGSSGGHWDSSDSGNGPAFAADGTTTGSGLTMVGERGRELRVLGNGSNEGDGIVPNHLTENLMKLGQYSPREWANNLSGSSQKTSVNQYSYNFDRLVLPNVTDANGLIRELKGIKNQAIQMGGRRS